MLVVMVVKQSTDMNVYFNVYLPVYQNLLVGWGSASQLCRSCQHHMYHSMAWQNVALSAGPLMSAWTQ